MPIRVVDIGRGRFVDYTFLLGRLMVHRRYIGMEILTSEIIL